MIKWNENQVISHFLQNLKKVHVSHFTASTKIDMPHEIRSVNKLICKV